MNEDVVMGLCALFFLGVPLLGMGLLIGDLGATLFSLFPLSVGFYLPYRGIPLELRERRYRAGRRRWEELDEELKERDKKKREGVR